MRTHRFAQIFMIKRYAVVLMFLLASAVFLSVPFAAEAATLHLSPSSGNYYGGENFKVHVLVSSDVTANAISGILNFPTRYIKVVNIDKKDSVLNFWIEEPSFSNSGALGNIRFEGVALNPGFTGSGKNIVTITFRADEQGTADINFYQSTILANDGLGTNIDTSTTGARFTLLPQRVSSAPDQNTTQKPQVIFVKELSQGNPSAILSFWDTMPGWVQVSIAISIGLSTIIFSLIILSFGAIVLVWLWSNIWHRRYQFFFLLHSSANALKNVVRKVLHSSGVAEKEFEEDVDYGVQRLAEEFKTAMRPLSFGLLIRNYFFLLHNIVRRFFMKNTTEVPNEHTYE